jgi:L-alanine-DL-glutamate epimerase-like enolase superfamily enzyme
LKIVGVSTAVVEANYDYAFVRIHTDEGLHGTGECFPTPAVVPLMRELAETLVGLDPRRVEPLTARMRHLLSGTASSFAAGIAYNVMSGIETALWDLAGKLDGRPVVELLGGRYQDDVPLYMDCHAGGKLESMTSLMRYRTPAWMSKSGETEYHDLVYEAAEPGALNPKAWVDRAHAAIDAGFTKLKFDLDIFETTRRAEDMTLGSRELEQMFARAHQLRESVGPDIDIAFDCHWRFDVPTAIRVAEGLAAISPMWLEDPVPPLPGPMAAVTRRSPVPIATGENTYLVEGFLALIEAEAMSVATPDAQKAGGLAETKRIMEAARRAYLPTAPHCVASPLGLLAAAHVCAASANVLCLEFHGADVPFWHELVDQPVIERGLVRVPDRPGLGVELDEEVVTRYSRPGEAVFACAATPG